MDPRIEFAGVRKTFRMRNRSDALRDAVPRLLGRLVGRAPPPPARFVALDGVSFRVEPGEVLGIVGANGAGKSTALRLAAGIYRPDGGVVSVRGRVSALIELSAGFHPDLSGRENVYLVGALLGLKRREVDAVLDPVVAFADIGEFLDSPVRTYSTGMAVRLGFSVAAHVPAEILLVDEVLAVGDMDFQSKCLRRMTERRRDGATILFVSHNLRIMEQFCDRVLFLHHGRAILDGPPRASLDAYRRFLAEEKHLGHVRESATPQFRRGTGEVLLDGVRVAGEGAADGTAAHGGALRVEARWTVRTSVSGAVLGVQIHDMQGVLCEETRRPADLAAGTAGVLSVLYPRLTLLPGHYEVSVFVMDPTGAAFLDLHQRLYPLVVSGPRPEGEDGMVALDPRWTVGPAAR